MSGDTLIAVAGGVVVLINVIGLLLLVPRNVTSAAREPGPFGDEPLAHEPDAPGRAPERVMARPELDGERSPRAQRSPARTAPGERP